MFFIPPPLIIIKSYVNIKFGPSNVPNLSTKSNFLPEISLEDDD